MKAMILAAGLGQRMRPLTDQTPKPMLCVKGKPLLQYHLEALLAAGISDVVINLAYLGDKIREFVGDGSDYGINVMYSSEPEPLETAGALLHALPLLGEHPFLLINGDVLTDYPMIQLAEHTFAKDTLAHLVLVANPDFHPNGDFTPDSKGRLVNDESLNSYTFAGLSIIKPELICTYPQQRRKFPLGEVLRYNIAQQKVTSEVYLGAWSDVGTPKRLAELNQT